MFLIHINTKGWLPALFLKKIITSGNEKRETAIFFLSMFKQNVLSRRFLELVNMTTKFKRGGKKPTTQDYLKEKQ